MKNFKKLTSLMLAVMMTVSLLPVNAMAEEVEPAAQAKASVVIEETVANEEANKEADLSAEDGLEDLTEAPGEEELNAEEAAAENTNGEEAIAETAITEETEVVEDADTSVRKTGSCGANINWTLLRDGTLILQGTGAMYNYYDDNPWSIEYPDTKKIIVESGITQLSYGAFKGMANLTSIELPNTLTSIGIEAFCSCRVSDSFKIPDSVTYIGERAFQWGKFSDFTFSSGTRSILDSTFEASTIGSLVIPEGVTSIGENAFNNAKLTSISLPSTLTSIGAGAFTACKNLNSITVPGGVKTIGSKTFSSSAINSIVLSEGVTSIGENAFNNAKLTSISLPSTLTSIGDNAFRSCGKLKSIKLPKKLTTIGQSAFISCILLGSITIPDSVTSVGDNAFNYCIAMKKMVWSKNASTISQSAFRDCSSLTEITIPEGVTCIDFSAFVNCSSLTSVVIPNGVTMLYGNTFKNCSALESVTIPDTLTTLGDSAFAYCTALVSITIPDSVETVGRYAFAGCNKLKTVKWSKNSVQVGSYGFAGCTALTKIDLSDSLEIVGDGAFSDCTSLKSIYLSKKVSYIGDDIILNDKLKVYVWEGSYAHTYCQNKGIDYYLMDRGTEIKSLSNTTTGIKLSWLGNPYATKYLVVLKSDTTLKKTVTGTSLTISKDELTSGKTYQIKVGAYINGEWIYSYSKTIKYLSSTTLTLSNTYLGITLNWTKVKGAKGYIIYRKTSKEDFVPILHIDSGTTVSYTDDGVKDKNGTTYVYAVRPYNGTYYGAYKAKTMVRLKGKQSWSVTNIATNKMVVKWSRDSNVTGYQIQYSKSWSFSSGNKIVTVTPNTTVSKTIGNLTRRGTYYIRMRTYKTVGGVKYYSGWSSDRFVDIWK